MAIDESCGPATRQFVDFVKSRRQKVRLSKGLGNFCARSSSAGPGSRKAMDYRDAFRTALERVRAEGRCRVFADLKRHRGDFPRATWTKPDGSQRDVIVWC